MHSRTLEPLLQSLSRCCALQQCGSFSDADLLERFSRSHDQEAFAELVRRHGPMVLGICRRLLSDRHAAEDAFQATFLVLVRKSARLRQPRLLAAWLHGVARRIALRLRSGSARWQRIPEDSELPETQALEPVDRLMWKEVRAILDEEIELLPSKYKLPVVLCYLQGQTYSEAAHSLGWPAGTLSVRLARAREQLRMRLMRRGLALSASMLGSMLGREALASPVPAALSTSTVNSSVCAASAPALAGFSSQVIALAEGALRTMWMTKLKSAMFAVLAAGMVCASLGGLVWHQGVGIQAQAPPAGATEAVLPAQPLKTNQERDVKDLEKYVEDLQAQLQEKQRLLAQLRQGNSLNQIEAALKRLKQANAGEPRKSAAVAEFEQAFGKLKQSLMAETGAEKQLLRTRLLERRDLFKGQFSAPAIFSDGHVLQVDLEKKQVLLSSGSKDGMKKGQLYRVYQSGKASPDQTGWVRVTDVNAKWSVGTVLQEFGPRAPMRTHDVIQLHDGKEPKGLEGN